MLKVVRHQKRLIVFKKNRLNKLLDKNFGYFLENCTQVTIVKQVFYQNLEPFFSIVLKFFWQQDLMFDKARINLGNVFCNFFLQLSDIFSRKWGANNINSNFKWSSPNWAKLNWTSLFWSSLGIVLAGLSLFYFVFSLFNL